MNDSLEDARLQYHQKTDLYKQVHAFGWYFISLSLIFFWTPWFQRLGVWLLDLKSSSETLKKSCKSN